MNKRPGDEKQAPEVDRWNVGRLIARLRADILSVPVDTFLGVEEDLLQRYGASRPTLRQAVRVLEHENLVVVRRGWSGGYYTLRPNDQDAVNAAVLYLQLHGFSFTQMLIAGGSSVRMLARAAAQSTDAAARAELTAVIDAYETADYPNRPVSEFIDAERALSTAISNLAGNPALSLFEAMLQEFGADRAGTNIFRNRPQRVAERVRLCVQRTRAILDGDVLVVDALSAKDEARFRSWIAEDAEKPSARAREGRRRRS